MEVKESSHNSALGSSECCQAGSRIVLQRSYEYCRTTIMPGAVLLVLYYSSLYHDGQVSVQSSSYSSRVWQRSASTISGTRYIVPDIDIELGLTL